MRSAIHLFALWVLMLCVVKLIGFRTIAAVVIGLVVIAVLTIIKNSASDRPSRDS